MRWARATRDDSFGDVKPKSDGRRAWDKRQPYPEADLKTLLEAAPLEMRVLVLKVRFADRLILTRRLTSAKPLTDPARLLALARELLTPELLAGRPVRLLGLSVQNQVAPALPGAQLPLFPEPGASGG